MNAARSVLALAVLLAASGCSSSDSSGPAGADPAGTGGALPSSGGGTSASGGSSAQGTGGAAASSGGAVAASGGDTGSHTNPISQANIDALVAAHNAARSGPLVPAPNPPLPPVSWDPVLADVAFNYLSKCQSTTGSLVGHNANRTADYAALGGKDYVGENIFGTTAQSVDPAGAVGSWTNEAAQFDYAAPDFGTAGHYTQVVWRNTTRIGCAIVDCPNVKFHSLLLCDYAPGGNITGQKPY